MEIRFYITYRRTAKNGARRVYRREFLDLHLAEKYAQRKMQDAKNEHVNGFEHHIYDGVTYCFKLAL